MANPGKEEYLATEATSASGPSLLSFSSLPLQSSLPAHRDDNSGESVNHGIRKGKAKPVLNCAECRRLKIKCDRRVPCTNCSKRGVAQLCPRRTVENIQSILQDNEILKRRVRQLERNAAVETVPQGHQVENQLRDTSGIVECPKSVGDHPTLAAVGGGGGTLMITRQGGTRYIGPSAASQWLRQGPDHNTFSRDPSPSPESSSHRSDAFSFEQTDMSGTTIAAASTPIPDCSLFGPTPKISYLEAYRALPPLRQANSLMDSYFRHIAWHGTNILRSAAFEILSEIYHSDPSTISQLPPSDLFTAFQKLALVMCLLAFGAHMNPDLPPRNPESKRWMSICEGCLVNGHFLSFHTLRGLQALALLGKVYWYTEGGGSGDHAWQIWGLCTRIMLAMGLHRDGERWNLSLVELDERRRVFYDIAVTDVFHVRAEPSRSGLALEFCDTRFPFDHETVETDSSEGLTIVKCRFFTYVKRILDERLRPNPSPYSNIVELWQELVAFERGIPYYLRCRSALKAMVSTYVTSQDAEDCSPAASIFDPCTMLQQSSLSLSISAAISALLRPYFVDALYNFDQDPTLSPYAGAYMAVIERSIMQIALLEDLYNVLPAMTVRHWFFFTYVFNAAVFLGTVCVLSPRNPLAYLCRFQLDKAINLFERASQSRAPPHGILKNLEWLRWINQCCQRKDQASSPSSTDTKAPTVPAHKDEPINPSGVGAPISHLDLVGWGTRLIELGEKSVRTHADPRGSNLFGSSFDLSQPLDDTLPPLELSSSDFLDQLFGLTQWPSSSVT